MSKRTTLNYPYGRVIAMQLMLYELGAGELELRETCNRKIRIRLKNVLEKMSSRRKRHTWRNYLPQI